jgi:hypothetical protein
MQDIGTYIQISTFLRKGMLKLGRIHLQASGPDNPRPVTRRGPGILRPLKRGGVPRLGPILWNRLGRNLQIWSVKLPLQHGLMVSALPATEETIAMDCEIESGEGMGWQF